VRFDVVTIFPSVFPGPLAIGVVGRAIESGSLSLHVHDLRDHTADRHRQVDDMQFGGGAGMVLKPEPLIRAVRALRDQVPGLRSILLSPQGRLFTQDVARELAAEALRERDRVTARSDPTHRSVPVAPAKVLRAFRRQDTARAQPGS